jgi:hypothetical protein
VRSLGAFTIAATALLAAPWMLDRQPIADCAAPIVKFKPTRVARGGVLTITGQNFGDCLSSGTVPGSVGPLGTPLVGLAIVIDQGDREFLVARGSADSDYEFEVEIVVPEELEPGEASLNLLGGGDARLAISPTLVISGAQPISSAEATLATFGPQPNTDTEADASVPPPILPADIPDENAATVPPLSTAPVEIDGSDSDHQRRILAVGFAVAVAIGGMVFALWSRSKRRGW